MHLLAAQAGTVPDGEAEDLGQTPAEVVILSSADSELTCFALAHDRLVAEIGEDAPTLRLATMLRLGHHLSVDLYVDGVIRHAKLVIVRLMGGVRYWSYGIEQVADVCRRHGVMLAVVPGDDRPDPELVSYGTVPPEVADRLWRCCVHGGIANAFQALSFAASLLGRAVPWREPVPVARAGCYRFGFDLTDIDTVREGWSHGAPVCAIIFYRALVLAGDTDPVDALIAALVARGLNPLPIAVTSLKEPAAAAAVAEAFAAAPPHVILNATAFAIGSPGADRVPTVLDEADRPVLQVVFSGMDEASWRSGAAGLLPRDIAMNVALPEVDGRVLTRAVSFKAPARRHEPTQSWVLTHRPVPDRIEFVADLAAAWARLRDTPPRARKVALIMANYPNRDGRLANGVGLDTPAGVVTAMAAMRAAGYDLGDAPADAATLIAEMSRGPTNDFHALDERITRETYRVEAYRRWFERLPDTVRAAVTEHWGDPAEDVHVRDGAFRLAAIRYGNVVVAIQPARGYHIDPARSYHDPALVPPHAYLAFHAWLREVVGVHAVVHFGKHGNLEWLPGKSLALSAECFPEVALGPMPHLYPFIVNDPGEGAQAKRRAQAVIIDHLTPPLTRAESYGPTRALETLVDEYYEAASLDPRRLPELRDRILDLGHVSGLAVDCGVTADDDPVSALAKLDNHLCELKELQIRDGLHIFGRSPEGEQRDGLLVALTRVPRGDGVGPNASLIRALAADLNLPEGFDPLDCVLAEPWIGSRPPPLLGACADPWRTAGDTVERLELLALALVSGAAEPDPAWTRTGAVLTYIRDALAPTVDACGAAELDGLLRGLDGRFVPPGPSGAPTRGRPEVLPTGRNFYSVDTRAVPTPSAWALGWKSAGRVVERYAQEHGEWPRTMALSVWGTANMRTGGDDIAQALALVGVRPVWDVGSGRVSGFEIMPAGILDRPRVDVTLRVSGFFRDAFPGLIELFDAAARAVAALDEAEEINPLAARFRADRIALERDGVADAEAAARAGRRVFGSKPGAYGAGLQALIDERGWRDEGDLAEAFVIWGSYAYGGGAEGAAARDDLTARLSAVQLVLHNQDNREHDLLDSDDYYQFEGGMTAAVRHLSGRAPEVFHNDHSHPESPRVRTLREEIARVVRGRAVNPKWIAGVMRHGYKGAFEMAATVDYLFAFAATAHCVADHHFDAVCDAYIGDEDVRDFIARENPAALREMAERLLEAIERGLWRPRSNSAAFMLNELIEKREMAG